MELTINIRSAVDAEKAIKLLKSYLVIAGTARECVRVHDVDGDRISVSSIRFTVRTEHALAAQDINWLDQLLALDEMTLLKFPNLGRKSLKEIIDTLNDRGLRLSGPTIAEHLAGK